MSAPVTLERVGPHFARSKRSRKTLCGRETKFAFSYVTIHGVATPCVPCVAAAGKLLTPKPRIPSALELAFDAQAERERVSVGMVKEFRFAESAGRMFRFDRAWPEQKVAVELDGGTFMAKGKSHGWGTGREDDAVRDACATLLSWKLFRVTPNILAGGYCWRWLRIALGSEFLSSQAFPKGRELRPPKMRPAPRRAEARA